MKTIKGIAIFIFFSVLFGSCFSPPEFSAVPSISYKDVYFKEGNEDDADTLAVIINFQDGDGDLGLGDMQLDPPYNAVDFYIQNSNGDTIRLHTYSPYTNLPPFVDVPDGLTGTPVTVRTPGFPEYECPYRASAYLNTVLVEVTDTAVFRPSVHHLDSVMHADGFQDVYVLTDTFYYRPNPTHFNIDVEFLIKQNDDTFVTFDWKNELCLSLDMSGRFPVLTDSQNPLEGTLKYAMTTTGFNPLFRGKILKLRIRIRDRALHVSNITESKIFSLDDIRR